MQRLGKSLGDFLQLLGEQLQFFSALIRSIVYDRFEAKEFLTQLSQISWRALPTTLTAGLFTGAILAMQFHMQLKDFNAESTLGGLNTSGTLREVGPVLIAFMLAGKVGAFTSAEIGTMKVTDQVDAIRCMGINPIPFLIVPRFLAVVVSSILLLSFGLVVSVFGGMIAARAVAGLYPVQYLATIPRFANLESLSLAVSKALIFGVLMGHVCCANGYRASGGTQGVGRAVKDTAVQSMVAIVLSDFAITWILNGLWRLKEAL